MIRIGVPRITVVDGKARLSAAIAVDDAAPRDLWFEVEERYGEFLCYERSDAFVLGLLKYAMCYGHDIECEAPMTDSVYEKLTEQFLPCFNRMHNDFVNQRGHCVRISAPVADDLPAMGRAVGTGISCGVDSLHVFAAHPDVTHACIWNVHGVAQNETSELREVGWRNLVRQAREFCEETKHELVIGDTNFDRGCLPDLCFDGSTTFGNLFAVHCLQKLWRKYYVASTYCIRDFSLSLHVDADPAHYEYLLFPFASTSNCSIRMDAPAMSRTDKVRDLIEYLPSRKYLNVCWEIHPDHKNGTYDCPKCMRTVLNIWAWDALDKFCHVFDIDYVRVHPEDFIAEMYRGILQRNPYYLEMREHFKAKNLPLSIRMKAWRIVFKKALLKVLRMGKTNHKFIAH